MEMYEARERRSTHVPRRTSDASEHAHAMAAQQLRRALVVVHGLALRSLARSERDVQAEAHEREDSGHAHQNCNHVRRFIGVHSAVQRQE